MARFSRFARARLTPPVWLQPKVARRPQMSGSLTRAELLALPAVVDLATAARALGIGRTKAYELAQTERFPCELLRVGNRYRCRTTDLLRLLNLTDDAA